MGKGSYLLKISSLVIDVFRCYEITILSGAAGRRLGSSRTDYYVVQSTSLIYGAKGLFSHTYSFRFDTFDMTSREPKACQLLRVTLVRCCEAAGQCSGLLDHSLMYGDSRITTETRTIVPCIAQLHKTILVEVASVGL